MTAHLNLEDPIITHEQFEEILNSYKSDNIICSTCNPRYYEPTCLIEMADDYVKKANNYGLSRISFHWKNVFTDYNLDYEDISTIIDVVSDFFSDHPIIFSIKRNKDDFVLEFIICPEFFRAIGFHVVNHNDMLKLTKLFNDVDMTYSDIVYDGDDTMICSRMH